MSGGPVASWSRRVDHRQAAIIAAALLAATLTGPLVAAEPVAGIGLVAALVFVVLAFANPVLALSGWVTLVFLSGIPGTRGAGANYALLVVVVAWFGALVGGRTAAVAYLRAQPVQVACVGTLVLWASVTLTWAPDPSIAGSTVLNLVICALVLAMVATLPTRTAHLRWLVLGFVAGTTLSVLAGAAMGGLRPTDAFAADAAETGRLVGAGSDANYLAAAIVPAIVLAVGLMAHAGRPLLRLTLAGCVVVLGVGLAATESRGGFLAAGVVCVGALVLLRGRRLQVASLLTVLVLAIGAWFAVSPGSWERVRSVSDGGSGRTDIWHVAQQVGRDHALFGVGLDQFPVVSPRYLDRPGAVARGDLLVSRRIVVHNLYLQAWVELGVVGLLLYLTIAAASVRAAWLAARAFARSGEPDLTALARTVVLAVAGALTASVFLSNIDDRRTWVLLGLGPALLVLSSRARAGHRP